MGWLTRGDIKQPGRFWLPNQRVGWIPETPARWFLLVVEAGILGGWLWAETRGASEFVVATVVQLAIGVILAWLYMKAGPTLPRRRPGSREVPSAAE